MRMPGEQQIKKWNHFMVGMIFGAILAYILFIFMNGQLHEQLLTESYGLEAELSELKKQYELLEQDKEDLDEQAQRAITIEKAAITILNEEDLRLDRLITHQMNEQLRENIDPLLGKELAAVEQSSDLLIRTLEGHPLTIDEVTYRVKVERLIIAREFKLVISISLAKESYSQT